MVDVSVNNIDVVVVVLGGGYIIILLPFYFLFGFPSTHFTFLSPPISFNKIQSVSPMSAGTESKATTTSWSLTSSARPSKISSTTAVDASN